MSSRRRFFLTFISIIIDAALLVGFFVVRDAAMLNVLKKEVSSLSELDMTKDRYNTKIKTRGSYQKIEKEMKSYLDHDAVLLQDSMKIVKDSKLTSILSYENYEKDGPEFQDSLSYLNQTKKEFDQNMDTVISDLEEEAISKYASRKFNNKDSRDLFIEFMDSMKNDFVDNKELFHQNKDRIDHILDVSIQVLNFLVANKEDWVLEEGEIRFRTDALYNQYMEYINSLNV